MLLFFDGFDYYNDTVIMASKWKTASSGPPTFNSSNGRNGGGTVHFGGSQANSGIYRWGASPTTVYLAFAIKFTQLTSSTAYFAYMYDSSTSQRCCLGHTSTGDVVVHDGNGTSLGTYGAGLTTGVWYHFQWKYTPALSCAANSNIVRLNNTQIINITAGTKTTSGSTYNCQGFSIGSYAGALNNFFCDFDDLYFLDNNGSVANDFMGDYYIGIQKPVSNGYYNQFTPIGSANNYSAVQSYDGDTSYCKTNDLYRQSFGIGTISDTMDSVMGIQNVSIARKEGAGSHSIKNLVRISGTDYEGSVLSLGSSYAQNMDLLTVNPATGSAWTQSDINALETGIRVSA